MTDIKLIIKMPEDIYKDVIENGFIYDEDNEIVTDVIKNGIPFDKMIEKIEAVKILRNIVNDNVLTVDVLNKIRAEIHTTAELHDDGDYYLRDKWIDEIFDKYKAESKD